METLKYKVIKTRKQYSEYCAMLHDLVFAENKNDASEEVIELLTLLIEQYDKETSTLSEVEPIRLLKSLIEDHNLKSKDLVVILGVSKGLVSDILNYKKGLSKEVIRKLADHFKLRQEAFNRPYKLKGIKTPNMKNAAIINTTKKLEIA